MYLFIYGYLLCVMSNVRMVLKSVKEMSESEIRKSGQKGFGLISVFLSVSQENLSLVLT